MLCELCGREMKVLDDRTAVCLICYSHQNCPFAFRPFPFLAMSRGGKDWNPRWPSSVPWGLMWPHKRQAQENHGQSLLRLAERGGFSPVEMVRVIEGARWRMPECRDDTDASAMRRIRAYRIHWLRQHPRRRATC